MLRFPDCFSLLLEGSSPPERSSPCWISRFDEVEIREVYQKLSGRKSRNTTRPEFMLVGIEIGLVGLTTKNDGCTKILEHR